MGVCRERLALGMCPKRFLYPCLLCLYFLRVNSCSTWREQCSSTRLMSGQFKPARSQLFFDRGRLARLPVGDITGWLSKWEAALLRAFRSN